MINNITEAFTITKLTTITQLVYKYIIYILPIIAYIFAQKIKIQLADRTFLKNEIYSPLYENIGLLSNNISEYKNCSNELDKSIMKSLQNTGKYDLIPQNLRKEIDSYHTKCEEYNIQLNNVIKKITEICINEVRKIKTEEDHERFINRINETNEMKIRSRRKRPIITQMIHITFSLSLKNLLDGSTYNLPQLDDNTTCLLTKNYEKWDNKITKDDLERNSISLEELVSQLFEVIIQNDDVKRFRQLQNELKNPEKLQNRLQERVNKPNLLFGKLAF